MKTNKKLHPPALALAVILFLTLVTSTASADSVQNSADWPYAYITNYAAGTVSVIDINTNTVTATVPVGITPFGVVINPEATKVYVTNWGSNNVSVINTATNTVIATVPVGSEPKGIAINPEGTKVYVANTNSTTVSVIDTATDTVTATVNVGSYPLGIAVNSARTKAYVTNYGSNTVSVIDTATNKVTATVKVGSVPSGVVVNPFGSKVYVANSGSNTLSVIDTKTNTVTATVKVGRSPFGVAIVAGSKLYVTNSLGNTVSIINTATDAVTATVPVGINPVGMAVNPTRSKVYVANHASNTVSIIDVAKKTVTATVPVGSGPTAFGQFMYCPPLSVGANLKIYKQAPSSITSGSSMTYTLYYYNFGNKDARNVGIEDALPDNVEFESASDGGVYHSDTRTVTWDIGSVSPDGHGYKTFTVKIPQNTPVETLIYNSVSISTSDLETNDDDNTARVWTWVVSKYHDPAGYIYDVNTLEPISNASVWLQIPDGIGGWENVSTGESVPIAQPDKNPLTTDEAGKYKWDVLNGSYMVHVEASGYEPADSIVVFIPPAVTDLDVGLISLLPVANFTSNLTSGNVPLSVEFTDNSQKATEWNWDFGDGTSSTDQNTTHTYFAAGNYTVNLTVSNEHGTDSKLATIIVSEQVLPVANFTSNVTSGSAPLAVRFTDTSTGTVSSYAWDFNNDGNIDSTEQSPLYTYGTSGTYTVNLTVSNADGSDSEVKTGYINVISQSSEKPVADFSASSTSGKIPLTVTFTDTSTGIPTKWKWSFGDGTTSTQQDQKHKYSKAGKYTVTLTVANTKGSNTVTRTDYIKVIEKPVANFTSSVTKGKSPLNVKFTDTSTGTPTKWKWIFQEYRRSGNGILETGQLQPSRI
ncbi:hypothetical protein ASJ81_12210 [Methanosarcina spelaei]|uniref:PKD domain-containing protein n=1 Tax=Methanosarcina spelaei TaxID=1036679 RepID=A0A2A2HN99_9EURY|nr:hypothetical protein ASJ81_12210 [Methanosarcina spelaei]